jgi:hypothetical protein
VKWKTPKFVLLVAVAFAIAFALGAWTKLEYSLQCTNCLLCRRVIDQRFLGVTFCRSTTEQTPPADYRSIFAQQCQHIFRRGGRGKTSGPVFARLVACGMYSEGILIRPRLDAVSVTYDAARRLGDQQLARETFEFINKLMPPDAPNKGGAANSRELLSQLSQALKSAQTLDDWRRVLQSARKGFPGTNP